MTKGFLEHVAHVPDPRVEGMVTYPLEELFLAALVGVLCGADDWEEVALCAEEKLDFLRKFLAYTEGVAPSQTLRRVFLALDSGAFAEAFRAWMEEWQGKISGVVAVDGKTLRGSKHAPDGMGALHLLSAFSHAQGVVIGQRKVDTKSNEITAIPLLLETLAIEGAIVTIDAMGAQKSVAAAIAAKEADYVLCLKGNQGALQDAVALFCDEESTEVPWHRAQETDGGHGRIEERCCLATEAIRWLPQINDWASLRSVARITAVRTDKRTGKSSTEIRHYLTSLPPDAAHILACARAHWSIENTLHWSLDVTFRDDHCRSRKDHAALNFAIIKHAAFNILKKNTEPISLKNKRKKAGWNHQFLTQCLQS